MVGQGVWENGTLHETLPQEDDRPSQVFLWRAAHSRNWGRSDCELATPFLCDLDDLDEPVTPSHLLIGRRVLSLLDDLGYRGEITDVDFEVTPVSLSRRVKYLNGVLNQFWRRWRNEYLLELRDAHRNRQGVSTQDPIIIGDLVLVHDEGQPRGFWRLAKVEDTIVGRDGQIRRAKLRVSARGDQSTSLQRPLSLLYP